MTRGVRSQSSSDFPRSRWGEKGIILHIQGCIPKSPVCCLSGSLATILQAAAYLLLVVQRHMQAASTSFVTVEDQSSRALPLSLVGLEL
jgi:hypothetical protein